MVHTGLAVAEARWWNNGNDSVRPLFETLAGIVEGNPHSVRYDMFVDESSLTKIIQELTVGDFHSLYIGSHGNENAIGGLGDIEISRAKLRNMLRNSNSGGSISGLYFGSCLIGTAKNAAFWLTEAPTTGLQWVAGYTESVDWIDSSAIDMIFWSKYLHERKTNRSRKKGKKTEIQMMRSASTVFNELGFNIYHLDTGGALTSVW